MIAPEDRDVKKRFSILSTTTVESWSTDLSAATNTESVSQSKSSSSTSTRAVIPIEHRLVSLKGPYIGLKKCCECRKYLIYYTMKKEEIFMCEVCGVRVHGGCVNRITNNCVMTTQYAGGWVHNAIVRSNKKRWDPCSHSSVPSASTPQSPVSLDNASSYKSKLYEDDDEEKLMTWEDVTIKPKDILVKDKIGQGRFGTVHFGVYHGDVAVKFVNMDYLEESKRGEAFKTEVVSAYKNSRHNHIALFLGYFIDIPTNSYAIVTNFYHGNTLYHRIHESNEEIDMHLTLSISVQICQAMSYLHKRNILHKDLRSKNILLDMFNKVFVADFGLLRFERLTIPKRNYAILIPPHWLDYVPPEIAASLPTSFCEFKTELPFSCEVDVFSFGTIFYELLMRKMPSGNQPWETKLFEKIIGTKAALNRINLQTQKLDMRVSQLLMSCWNVDPKSRPRFSTVVKALSSLLKRKEGVNTKSIRCFESVF